MAQKVNIILEDDLDGGKADETVRFSLDGGQFEIDLSTENAQKLRASVRPYADKARRVTNKDRKRTNKPAAQNRNSEIPKIRQWAKDNGYEVSDRGRIEQSIQDAYYEAQKNS